MSIIRKNNVRIFGEGKQSMVFAHGYGCDQNMWRDLTPAFRNDYRIVLFDHVGSGGSDLTHYDPVRYRSLHAYADDVLALFDELALDDAIFVGHSVSAMIGMLAAIAAPGRFSKLVMIGPSPCYIDSEGYRGGFSRADIESLLDVLDRNFLGWAASMAPVIMGNQERPELADELAATFCRNDPEIAKLFARATFLSDHRADLPRLRTPSLILQCAEDAIAPQEVGEYLHRALADSELVLMKAVGHCPHMSEPRETIAAIRTFLRNDRTMPAPVNNVQETFA